MIKKQNFYNQFKVVNSPIEMMQQKERRKSASMQMYEGNNALYNSYNILYISIR